MKARLLYRDRDFDRNSPLPWNEAVLVADLELATLFEGMAQGDAVVSAVVRTVILNSFDTDIDTIRYRQEVLRDCLDNADVVRDMYAIVTAATQKEADGGRSSLSRNPDWVLRWATATIDAYLGTLERLRRLAEAHRRSFTSKGMGGLLSSLIAELDADYCAAVRSHLGRLKFRDGMLLAAAPGRGNKSGDYVLLEPPIRDSAGWAARLPWLERLVERLSRQRPDASGFTIDAFDENGVKALASLRNQGLALVAGALGESVEHIRNFLKGLATELAFYVGCINLQERLRHIGMPICVPMPAPPEERRLAFEGLCEPALALTLGRGVVGNDAQADGKELILITGANQGGKSTFLRSVGLAQLMMQNGMFVTAEAFCASLVDGLATHFRREEVAGMDGGRLDDELARMSDIVDHVTPHMMIMLNESFAATNEREGSEIARQILSPLLKRRLRMLTVTHFYDLAQSYADASGEAVLFLRAERSDDGSRSFRMVEGGPLRTGYGEDLYREIFGDAGQAPDEGP
jgi:hypothetical protein